MSTLWGREPAAVLAAVQAVLALAVGFGLGLSGEQVSLIVAASAAVLGLVTRSQVTPVHTAGDRGHSALDLIVGVLVVVILVLLLLRLT